jgi:gliding motility-associated-like protein
LVIPVSPAATTSYTLVSVADQCSATGTVNGTAQITVQPVAPPSLAVIDGDATICSGTGADFTITISGGAGPYEVVYTDGTSTTTLTNYVSGDLVPVVPSVTTTYTLVSVTDSNGCNSLTLSGDAVITVEDSPVSAVLSGDATICAGSSATLSVEITSGTAPFSFIIDNGVGLITGYTSGDAILVNPAASTTYAILGNITDSNGCSVLGSGSAVVTVADPAAGVLSGTTAICPGQTANLTITLSGLGPWDVTYNDGTADITVSGVTSSPLNIPVTPAASTIYSLVSVTDACGAGLATGSVSITVRDANDPICVGTGIGCFAYSISILEDQTNRPSCSNQNDGRITLDVTGVTPGNYIIRLVSPTVTLTQIGPSGIYTFAGLSPDNYEYYVEDAAGNICQQPYNLPIETSIVATATDFVDVSCFGLPAGQAKFTIVSGGSSPYQYSIDGSNWFTFISGEPVTTLPPSGTYTVLIRDGENDLCPYPVTVTINNLNPVITTGFDTQEATCGNADGSIRITTAPSGGTGGPYTYLVDGSPATPVNDVFANLFGGNHIITVIDNSGCEREFAVFIPYPDFIQVAAVNSTDASCDALGSIAILIDNFIPAASYEVAITNSISTVPIDFLSQYYLGNGVIVITELPRGNYFIWLRTSGSQCPTLVNNLINNVPIVLLGPVPIAFDFTCRYSNGDLQLTNITGAPGIPYQYQVFGNGFTVTGTISPDPLGNAIISGFTSGPYAVNLIQDQGPIGGCTTANTGFINAPPFALDTLSVRVPDPFTKFNQSFPEKGTAARVIKIQESGLGDYEIRLELTEPFGAVDPNPLRDWAIVNNQETRYDNLVAGNYILSLRDGYGCQKDYNLTVEMFTGIWIPNIFTPNNDGFNDNFFIRNLPASGANLIVSNRYGTRVYSSSNYQNDWDGGKESDGVYYYRLEVGSEVFTGWVEVLRGAKP